MYMFNICKLIGFMTHQVVKSIFAFKITQFGCQLGNHSNSICLKGVYNYRETRHRRLLLM